MEETIASWEEKKQTNFDMKENNKLTSTGSSEEKKTWQVAIHQLLQKRLKAS